MTKVFVYGTLKEGFRNNWFLADSHLIGLFATSEEYDLYDLGWFPGMVKGLAGCGVSGEVYEVDAGTLKALDGLESEGVLYERIEIDVSDGDSTHRVFSYLYLGSVEGCELLESGFYSGSKEETSLNS